MLAIVGVVLWLFADRFTVPRAALVGDAVLRNPNGAELLAALGSDAESRDG